MLPLPVIEEKRKGGPADMRKFWDKHGPNNKVQTNFNHLGQPCGMQTSKLTNFLSTLVKGKDVSVNKKIGEKCHILRKRSCGRL